MLIAKIGGMTVNEIRRAHINFWADKLGRDVLAAKVGYPDTIYINQLCGGHGSFGGKTARKIEKALGLKEGAFDHPLAVKEDSVAYEISQLNPDHQSKIFEMIRAYQILEKQEDS